MFEVKRIYEGIRTEGFNQGVLCTFVQLGTGSTYNSVDDFMAELYPLIRTNWVCFQGEDTIRVGMGTLIQGLKELRFNVEVIYSSYLKEPGWFNSVDLWMVDYQPKSFFSYSKLRPKDSIRYKVPEEVREDFLLGISDSIGMCAAIRLVSLESETEVDIPSLISNFGRQDRLRIGKRQE